MEYRTKKKKGSVAHGQVNRLSHILTSKREFRARLSAHTKIQIWRHAAIATSRRHLKQAKFHEDYGIGKETTWNDAQACHMAGLARSIYAPAIEEAPGHVATARAEHRQVSRARYSWLGFALHLGGRAGACEACETSLDLKTSLASSGVSSKQKALSGLPQGRGTKRRND